MKKLLSILGLFILLLTGCSSANTNVYVYPTPTIEGLDPLKASYSQTFQLLEDVYAGLYRVTPEGEVIPELATDKPTVSDDGLTYTFKLRQDAVWYDSTGQAVLDEAGNPLPITAHDFVYSYQRMIDPAMAGNYGYIFDPILNATELLNGEVAPDQLGVTAIDDYTLEIKLDSQTPYFESLLTFQAFYPVSKVAVETFGENFAVDENSTYYSGPFYVESGSYDLAYQVSVRKNENYYGADQVQIDGVDYRTMEDRPAMYNAYNSGEIDYTLLPTPEDVDKHMADGSAKVSETGYMFYAALNYQSEFENEDLRKAFAYGFDRDTITKSVFGSEYSPVTSFVPSGLTTSAYGVEYTDSVKTELATYDTAKSQEHLDKYMKDKGITDPSAIEITLLTSDSSANVKIAEAVQASYQQTLGVTMIVEKLPSQAYVEARRQGNFDFNIGGWGADYADPSSYLGVFTTDAITSGINTSFYSNEEFDKLYAAGLKETDPQKRMELFAKAEQKLITEDAVIIPFYQKNDVYLESEEFESKHLLFQKVSNMYTTSTVQ